MLKTTLLARLLPGLAVSGVLAASFIASPAGSLLSSLSGYGYGACGYGTTYTGSPSVTGVVPNQGSTAGGTTVQITGSGFCNSVTAVKFGTTGTGTINVMGDTLMTVVSPAHAAGTVDITVTNAAGTSATSTADQFTFKAAVPTVYTAVTPRRVLDTRTNGGTLGQGGDYILAMGGVSVPSNATSVIINVTVTNTSTSGALIVYPTGASQPVASNLNWSKGETVPNLVSVSLGTGGDITIHNIQGSVDVVVDLEGYFAVNTDGLAGEFAPLAPSRITDTRTGSGKPNAGSTLNAGSQLDIQVTGAGGVPATGAAAVVMNVTVTNTTASSALVVWPTGASRPLASNLNWIAGKTVPNRVVVPIGTGGKVSVFNYVGKVDVVVDVNGYFTDGSAGGSSFVTLTPSRITDTRAGSGFPNAGFTLNATNPLVVTVAGQGGVPASGATAAILNVTVTNTSSSSALTVYPDGTALPTASDLNWLAGVTVPNLVVVQLSGAGKIDIRNLAGTTDVVVDVVGYFA